MKHRAGLIQEHELHIQVQEFGADTCWDSETESDLKTKQYRIHQTRWQNSLQIVCKNKWLSTAIFLSDLKGNIRVVHSCISTLRFHRNVCISAPQTAGKGAAQTLLHCMVYLWNWWVWLSNLLAASFSVLFGLQIFGHQWPMRAMKIRGWPPPWMTQETSSQLPNIPSTLVRSKAEHKEKKGSRWHETIPKSTASSLSRCRQQVSGSLHCSPLPSAADLD